MIIKMILFALVLAIAVLMLLDGIRTFIIQTVRDAYDLPIKPKGKDGTTIEKR